jgi:hypothetical protein
MATESPAPEPAPAPAASAPAPAPAPPTDPKMQSAVNFLLDPSVMGMPAPKLTPYLKQRLGLTDDQVKEAFKLAGAAPRPRQDKIMTAVEFLENEQVKDKPLQMKVTYLKTKLEMTDPEIAAALSQTAGPPPPEVVQKAMSFLQTGPRGLEYMSIPNHELSLSAVRRCCAQRPSRLHLTTSLRQSTL